MSRLNGSASPFAPCTYPSDLLAYCVSRGQRFAARALWACAACVATDPERVARLVRMGVAAGRAAVALQLAGGCVRRAATVWIAVDDPAAAEGCGTDPADGPGGAACAAAWIGTGAGRERDVQGELLAADGLEVISGMLHQVPGARPSRDGLSHSWIALA